MSNEAPQLEREEKERERDERDAFLERSRMVLKRIAETSEDEEAAPENV